MKIIRLEEETVIYPFLDNEDIEEEIDYSIVLDKNDMIHMDGDMFDKYEIQDMIDTFEKILEWMDE